MSSKVKFNKSTTRADSFTNSNTTANAGTVYFPTDSPTIIVGGNEYGQCVTDVSYHYAPTGSYTFSVDASGGSTPTDGTTTQVVTGIDVLHDAAGHVTEVRVDSAGLKNTHYTSKTVVASTTTGTTDVTVATSNPYLNHVENSSVTSYHQIKGSGATTVKTDTSANIIISSTDTKVTSAANHYTPTADSSSTLTASSTTAATWGSTSIVTGLSRDAKGHVVGVSSIRMPASPTDHYNKISRAYDSGIRIADISYIPSNEYISSDSLYVPTASSTQLGVVKTSSTVTSNAGYTATPIIDGIPYYQNTNYYNKISQKYSSGLNIADITVTGTSSSNTLYVPTASSTQLGVVKTSSTVTSNTGYTATPIIDGIPYYKNTTYGIATYNTSGLVKPWYSHTAASTGPTAATDSTVVTVNAKSSTAGKYYPIEMDSNGRMFVNVPWTNTTYDLSKYLTSHAYGFGKVTDGTSTISATTSNDTLTLVGDSKIALTYDTTNKKITFAHSTASGGSTTQLSTDHKFAKSLSLTKDTTGHIVSFSAANEFPDMIKVMSESHAETASGTNANSPTTGMAYTAQKSLYMTTSYNDSAMPTTYGNVINLIGAGTGQIMAGWSGTDSKTGSLYYRSHRDTSTGGWGAWKQFISRTPSTSATGSSINPIYIDSDGTAIASTGTVASGGKTLMYLNSGTLTASTSTVASGGKTLMYLNSGTLTASTGTVASGGKTLMYLNSGTLTASTSTEGGLTQPVYLNNGVISKTTYTLGASVPSDAVFTDHYNKISSAYDSGIRIADISYIPSNEYISSDSLYVPYAATTKAGVVTIGDNINVSSSGTISLNKSNVTTALGYTPPSANYYNKITHTYSSGLSIANITATGTGSDSALYVPIMTNTQLGAVKTWNYHGSAAEGPSSGSDTTAVSVNDISSTSERYYAIESDVNGYMFVNVPWTDNNTKYSAGTGLTLSDTTFKAKLNSETSLGTIGTTSKLYAVGVDANGKLAVNVPWTDTNTNTNYYDTISAKYTSGLQLATITPHSTGSSSSLWTPIATYAQLGVVKPWYSHTAASTGPTAATDSTAVAVNAKSSTAGRYYPIEIDSNGRMFVNVPWTDTNTDTNTDTLMTQTKDDSTNANYPILLSTSTITGTRTAKFDSSVTLNPSTNTITANITGQAQNGLPYVTITDYGTNYYPYSRFAYISGLTSLNSDFDMVFLIRQKYVGGYWGIFKISLRTNSSGSALSLSAKWLVRYGFAANAINYAWYGTSGSSCYADFFLLSPTSWCRIEVTCLTRTMNFSLCNAAEASGATSSDRLTSTNRYSSISDAATQLHDGTTYTGSGTSSDVGHVSSANYATTLLNARKLAVNLSSETSVTFNGSADQVSIPISNTLSVSHGGTGKTTHTSNAILSGNGTSSINNIATASGALFATSSNSAAKFDTLPVPQGGTGATTFTSGYALIGNGTGGIQTRAIKKSTAVGDIGWSSSQNYLLDQSAIAYWNGAYSGTTSNLAYSVNGKIGTASIADLYTTTKLDTSINSTTILPINIDLNNKLSLNSENLFGAFSRSQVGTAPSYDTFSYNGAFEIRASSEVTAESGTRPFTGYGTLFNIYRENIRTQLAFNTTSMYFRSIQASDPTLKSTSWRILANATNGVGSTTQPVYMASNGTITKTTYTLGASVPSGALFTDTKNTAGATNKTSTKLLLVGAPSQETNPQTYSNQYVYIGTDNCLYSNGSKVLTSYSDINVKQTAAPTSGSWPLLLARTNSSTDTEVTSTSYFDSGVILDVATDTISANIGGNAATATTAGAFTSAKTIALTGDVTGSASSTAGWSIATTLKSSGVGAGTYGPSSNVTGSNGTTITVPQITVDAKGRITGAANRTYTSVNTTYTIPSSLKNPNSLLLLIGDTQYGAYDGSVASTVKLSAGSNVSLSGSTDTANNITTVTIAATNTTYSAASSSNLGLVKIGSNITVSSGTISLTKSNVTSALGYTPPTSNTTYGIATYNTSGLVKPWYSHTAASTGPTAATDSTAVAVNAKSSTAGRYYPIEMDSNGRMFVNVPWTDTNTDTNTTYSAGTGLTLSGTTFKAKLNSETSLGTIGTTSKLYAVGVDANGKLAVNVPWTDTNTTYSTRPNPYALTFTAGSTTYSYDGSAAKGLTIKAGTNVSISDDTNGTITISSSAGTASSVSNSLTIKLNGTTAATYNGSAATTVNVTPSSIGAAASSHTHSYLPLAGGTMTGQILKAGGSTSYGTGRNIAMIRQNTYSSYCPILSMKTTNGSWELAPYSSDTLHWIYVTDTQYSNSATTNTVDVSITSAGVLNAPTLSEGGTTLANKYQAKGNYAESSHTHSYAASSSAGGGATTVAVTASSTAAYLVNSSTSSTSSSTALKVYTGTIGASAKPVFVSSGKITASSSSLGSANQPIYISNGELKACTYKIYAEVPSGLSATIETMKKDIEALKSYCGLD